MTLEANVFEAEDLCLVEGTKVLHNIHGPGEALAINRAEQQGKLVHVQFENGVYTLLLTEIGRKVVEISRPFEPGHILGNFSLASTEACT